jgi:hypothetical protein
MLEAIGVPRRSISRRCRTSGPWRRLLPGVVLLGNSEPTEEQRIRAAILYGGHGAMLTGLWALRRNGLRRLPLAGDVHVLVPATSSVTSSAFVVVERTTRLPAAHTRLGVPVAPVYRAVLDAARRLSDFDAVLAMMSEAIQRRRCTAQTLAEELEAGSRRGAALPRRALVPLLEGTHSVAEADAWNLWQRSGLPACRWNVKLFDANGRYLATPDAWCDDVGFAWEIDSRDCHAGSDDFADTLARDARYVAAGVTVLQTLPARLRTEPEKVVAEVRAAYETARLRPRPDIRQHYERRAG